MPIGKSLGSSVLASASLVMSAWEIARAGNRAGLIADANKCCKPLAFLGTAKESRKEQEQSQGMWQAGSDKQRYREGRSILEPAGCIRSCVSYLQTQAIFTCPGLLQSARSRSSFTWTAGRQVMLELWLELLLNVL